MYQIRTFGQMHHQDPDRIQRPAFQTPTLANKKLQRSHSRAFRNCDLTNRVRLRLYVSRLSIFPIRQFEFVNDIRSWNFHFAGSVPAAYYWFLESVLYLRFLPLFKSIRLSSFLICLACLFTVCSSFRISLLSPCFHDFLASPSRESCRSFDFEWAHGPSSQVTATWPQSRPSHSSWWLKNFRVI